ncbi:MAG: hypothetical protein CM15mP106_7370 [Candidatus Neomarinimicrobiota bacterium]|nr:MAG: hypothetical protein CM15mP106_7370 [Candidatus Neomarinimicrobiota bacterium]
MKGRASEKYLKGSLKFLQKNAYAAFWEKTTVLFRLKNADFLVHSQIF